VRMVLVLCIGDLHIPHRAVDLPAKFKALLQPGKVNQTLCTGNICTKEIQDYLKTITPNLHVARGDFDEGTFPDEEVLEIGGFRVGLCHGHQVVPWGDLESLALLQRRLDVDILVTGHTHEFKAYKYEDRLLINPGSATGAYGTMNADAGPSFVLMDINGGKATAYVYELIDGEIKVDKVEFSKASKQVL